MAWELSGQLIEACSCKALCPCYLGPAEPDQGWCSGALTFSIQKGQSEDVDLSGRAVLWLIDLPKDFASGNGTARLYVDDAANPDQRQELEAIFTGKKGGPWAVLSSIVAKWLPTQTATINISDGGSPVVSVGAIGQIKLQPTKDQAGRATTVMNAASHSMMEISQVDLARSDGSRFVDPEMRAGMLAVTAATVHSAGRPNRDYSFFSAEHPLPIEGSKLAGVGVLFVDDAVMSCGIRAWWSRSPSVRRCSRSHVRCIRTRYYQHSQSRMRMFRDRVPHLFRRFGHREIPYPKGRKRIDQRVHYRCAHRSFLPRHSPWRQAGCACIA